VSQIVIPLGLCWLIQSFGTLQAWHIWLAIVLGHLTRAMLSVTVFKRERWRSIRVAVGTAEA
jgi:Na+-driven multidrug efflux pump